jgi:hypothetical protein
MDNFEQQLRRHYDAQQLPADRVQALEVGVVARLHHVARLLAEVERGHDRTAATVRLAYAVVELSSLVLALAAEIREARRR